MSSLDFLEGLIWRDIFASNGMMNINTNLTFQNETYSYDTNPSLPTDLPATLDFPLPYFYNDICFCQQLHITSN
jgi:hypothetical protein